MSETTIRPLYIQLLPSKLLAGALALMTMLSVVVVLLLPMVWLAKTAFISMLLLWSVTVIRQRAFFLHPDAIIALEIDAHGQVQGITNDGEKHPIRILPDTVVTAWVVVPRFHLPHRTNQSLVLLPDMLDAQAFRRLRVWLRWGNPLDDALETSSSVATFIKRLQHIVGAWRT